MFPVYINGKTIINNKPFLRVLMGFVLFKGSQIYEREFLLIYYFCKKLLIYPKCI